MLLLEEQIPAELIVILFLRADVEHDIGDRQNREQPLAIGEIVAVDVGRVDEDLALQMRTIMRRQLADAQGRVEALGVDGLMQIDDRIARGGPSERRLGDISPSKSVEQ